MPFQSAKQKRWMYANKPGMAKKWSAHSKKKKKGGRRKKRR